METRRRILRSLASGGLAAAHGARALPAAVREKLESAMDATLASSECQQSVSKAWISPATALSPEKISAFVAEERKRWGDLIGKLNIQMEG